MENRPPFGMELAAAAAIPLRSWTRSSPEPGQIRCNIVNMAIVAADDADDEKLACVDQAKRCVLQDFGYRQTGERDLRKLSKINEIVLQNQQVCERLLWLLHTLSSGLSWRAKGLIAKGKEGNEIACKWCGKKEGKK